MWRTTRTLITVNIQPSPRLDVCKKFRGKKKKKGTKTRTKTKTFEKY